MRNKHSWRTKTADGVRRDMTARRFGRHWTLRSRVKGEEGWTEHEEIALADLKELREILFAKYQRKRVPWEYLTEIDALIAAGEEGQAE
jgi:hypothetical protein